MKIAMLVFISIICAIFFPAGLFAQQESPRPEAPAVAPGETEPRIFEEEEEADQEMMSQGMMTRHQQLMAKMREKNAELEQKIDTMNQATGERKVQAMADVINTMFSQRREMMGSMADMQGGMCKMMMGKQDGGMMSMKDGSRMMKIKKGKGDDEKSMIIIIQE